MSKSQKVFRAVSAELAKRPGQSVAEVCRKLKFGEKGAALYYNTRRAQKLKAPKARAVGYQRLKAKAATPAPTSDGRLVCLVGSPDQVRAFMAGGI